MKRLTLTALLALACATTIQARQIEYGDPSELKGVRVIFVDTGANMKLRQEIIKEIQKSKEKLPGLVISGSPDDAEVILAFENDTVREAAGVSTSENGRSSSLLYRTVREGQGVVYKPGTRMRILMSFEDTQKRKLLERRPSTNFAREFVKAYKKANGVK